MKPHEKKILKFLFILFLIAGSFGWQGHVNSATLAGQLKGRIVLAVESHGEAYYIYPVDLKRYYLGRPTDAFNVMRSLGLGISNSDLDKIPKNTDNWSINLGTSGNKSLISKVSGRILLQVQSHGEAWYINPLNNKRYYLGRPTDAFNIMRSLGLGITTANLLTIPQGSLGGSTSTPVTPVSATIVLLSPNGGESWIGGSTYNITWSSSSTSVSKINLFYSIDHWVSSPRVIVLGEANDGSYSWTVPSISSSTVKIMVEGADNVGGVLASDVSDADFTISVTSAGTPIYPLVNPQEMKILAVRVTSANPSSSLPTTEEISNALFGSSNYSVKNFYNRNSYGQISVSGEVLDATLDLALPAMSSGFTYVQSLSALDEKIDFSKYNHYNILFIVMEQGVNGQGSLKTGYPFESGEGLVNILPAVVTTDCIKNFVSSNTLIHELGHGLGLKHAGAWFSTSSSCGNIPLSSPSDNLCISTYGGGTVMGSLDEPEDLYIYQRKKLAGAQGLSKTIAVTSGTYSLGYFTRVLGASEYEELNVPATNGVYSVEFRPNMDIGTEKQNAVVINFIPNSDSFFSNAYPGDLIYGLAPESLLVAPRSNALTQVAPSSSGIFTDNLRNIKLEVLEIDNNHAKVQVSAVY
jgi:hypothetical protein